MLKRILSSVFLLFLSASLSSGASSSYYVNHTTSMLLPNWSAPTSVSFFLYGNAVARERALTDSDSFGSLLRHNISPYSGWSYQSDIIKVGTDRPQPGFIDAGATASASASIISWGNYLWDGWTGFTSSITSYGSSHASLPQSYAHADSGVGLAVRGGRNWFNTRVRWGWSFFDSVSGSSTSAGTFEPVRPRDPLAYSVFDDAGNVVALGKPVDIELDIAGEGAGFSWENNQLLVDPMLNFNLSITVADPFMVQGTGSLILQQLNGVIVQSYADGVFSGLALPIVGSDMGINMYLMDNIDLEIDLSSIDGSEVEWVMDNTGLATVVPEPLTCVFLAIGAGLIVRRHNTLSC